jgi:hypothetical protein
MLKEAEVQQQELELVTIESLAPADHLLRKIDLVTTFTCNGCPGNTV